MKFKKIEKHYISHYKQIEPLALFDKKERLAFINRPYPIKVKYKLAKGGRQ